MIALRNLTRQPIANLRFGLHIAAEETIVGARATIRNKHMHHPALEFGGWLKAKRQAHKIVARVFAMAIGLSPAEYAEVEFGIVKWLAEKQESLIVKMLELGAAEKTKFLSLLRKAREATALRFEMLFRREQLEPVRLCSPDGKQLTKDTKEAILDAVFAPL